MNNTRTSVSLSVYFLSVVCALLFGLIVGHFLPVHRATESKTELGEEPYLGHRPISAGGMFGERTLRDDILYYGPDIEKMWRGGFKDIPKGDTRIRGRVLLNGMPMEGLELALLFEPGRKTEPVTTNANGEYEISVPEDQYTLSAVLCYNKKNDLANKICLNKISETISYTIFPEPPFSERTKKEVPALMPDIEYRDPVQIVSPTLGSHEKLNRIRFTWTPYPGAVSYIVDISRVTKKANTTNYEPAMNSHVQKNSVDYKELLRTLQQPVWPVFEGRMEEKRWYTIRVQALDVNGKKISASSEHATDGIIFRVD